jgi:hypothetical protein
MKKGNVPRRRRLRTEARTRVTSYYTFEEQREIVSAAATLGVSLSSFIASVVLKEARRINSQKSLK